MLPPPLARLTATSKARNIQRVTEGVGGWGWVAFWGVD